MAFHKKAPTIPAMPINTLPAPTAKSLAAPLFAVPVAAAELEVPLPLLATLTAPLEPVVCAPAPVVDPVVATAEETGLETAALVVVP
jgi:hypothetical protein